MRFLAVLAVGTPGFAPAAPEGPRGEPPQPAARRINVADFGPSLADDDRDDTAALNAAFRAATSNSTLYFPAGTYNVRWVTELKQLDGVSLQGDGPERSVIKRMGPYWKAGATQTWENLRANYATDSKILRIEDCRNMCIRDLAFDANGTPTFGGVGIKRPRRLNITCTRAFDSREQPLLFGKDRFAWTVMGYEHGAEDIWFTSNRVEGLQTEMDGVSRVLVERCAFRRGVASADLAILSGHFSAKAFARGFHNTHVTVRRSYFSNSNRLSMGMLALQLDPASNCDTRFEEIEIVDNVFVYDVDAVQTPCAIKIGAGDSSVKTKGNVFERFRIEGNRIFRSPERSFNERFGGYIWYNCWAGEDRLNRSVIRGNRLFAHDPPKPLVTIQRSNQSADLTVADNTVHPYVPPPSVEEFLAGAMP